MTELRIKPKSGCASQENHNLFHAEYFYFLHFCLIFNLLAWSIPVISNVFLSRVENAVDPDQMLLPEARWPRSTVFSTKYKTGLADKVEWSSFV